MKQLLFLLITLVTITSCKDVDLDAKKFGIFSVQPGDLTATTSGVIGSKSLEHFNLMIETYPNLKTLILQDMPGSEDDETNVLLGRAVYAQEMETHIDDNFDIASGAVDLFLAGRTRSAGNNTRIGVHSWSDGTNEATDFAMDATEHNLFINYYKDIGYDDEWSSDFYFFTINAAEAADIHWMTEAEIEQYEMFTQ